MTLQSLLERVESASGADRGLDWQLHVMNGLWGVGMYGAQPAYTASLDDTLALVERVLPGWTTNVHTADASPETYPIRIDLRRYGDGEWSALLSYCHPKIDVRFISEATAPTPALALLAAMLRAKIGEGQ